MNETGFPPRALCLEQLESRCLLSGMPLIQDGAHFRNSDYQNGLPAFLDYFLPTLSSVLPSSVKNFSISDRQTRPTESALENFFAQLAVSSGSSFSWLSADARAVAQFFPPESSVVRHPDSLLARINLEIPSLLGSEIPLPSPVSARSSSEAPSGTSQRIEPIFAEIENLLAQTPFSSDSNSSAELPYGGFLFPIRPGLGPFNPGSFSFANLAGRVLGQDSFEDLQFGTSLSQSAFAPAFLFARSLISAIPNLSASQVAWPIASSKPSGLGQVEIGSLAATANSVFTFLTRAVASGFVSSLPGLIFANPTPPERMGNPPVGPAPSDDPSSVGPIVPLVERVGITDISAALLAGVLGRRSTAEVNILESGLRQFLEGVKGAKDGALWEDSGDGLVAWITAAAVTALACASGRRQMRKSTQHADREDTRDELRDLLFMNLDYDYE
jgi:hypothetical protein